MPAPQAVLIPSDEYLARPFIVAWLGYPNTASKRDLAIRDAQQWARDYLAYIGIAAPPVEGRKPRIRDSLRVLEQAVDRQLLVGETFRRQVIASAPDDIGVFGDAKGMPNRLATMIAAERVKGTAKKHEPQRETALRDYWRFRRGALSLAVGTCAAIKMTVDLRPDLETLLFTDREWVTRAITEAGKIRQLAIAYEMDVAPHLIDFRLAAF